LKALAGPATSGLLSPPPGAARQTPDVTSSLTETIGAVAALLTTLCWVPQAWRTIRTRDTRGISVWAQGAFLLGIALWLAYGLLLGSWPLIGANGVSFLLVGTILAMKLRYG
jgi:MtN3 and saliva related transmembrane protein